MLIFFKIFCIYVHQKIFDFVIMYHMILLSWNAMLSGSVMRNSFGPHGQRSLVDCSPWGPKEFHTTEPLSVAFQDNKVT